MAGSVSVVLGWPVIDRLLQRESSNEDIFLMPAEATSAATTTSPAGSLFDRETIAAVRRRFWLLLLGPVVAALAVYAINPDLPGMYVSTAYLRLDPATAESLLVQRKNPSLNENLRLADKLFG